MIDETGEKWIEEFLKGYREEECRLSVEVEMGFWDLKTIKLDEFRPGIWSKVENGSNLTMAVMEISAGKEGTAHAHSFDQCGYVVEGEIELSIGDEKRLMKSNEVYFIPAGITHGWKTFNSSAKILDVVGVIRK